MSLASLNKQKTLEKQQPQSIKTTVTISKVSRTPIDSVTPVMPHRKPFLSEGSIDIGSEPSIDSNESSQTVREMQKFKNNSFDATDDPLVQADVIAKRKQLAKERFLSEGSISNGKFADKWVFKIDLQHDENFNISKSKPNRQNIYKKNSINIKLTFP